MRNSPSLAVLLLVCSIFRTDASPVQEGDVPAWAENLRLTVFGGPAAGTITVSLNGEFLAEFDREPPVMTEISDLVSKGENEITFEIEGGDPGIPARDLRVAVAPVHNVTSRQLESGRPLAHVTVPGRIEGGECTETLHFQAGPVDDAPDLKDLYWLVVTGPPMRHMVSVKINGKTVVETLEGDAFYNITKHLARGKNEVEYAARATCLVRPTDREDDLEIFVSTGEEKADFVQLTGTPVALFRLSRDTKKDEVARRTAFRAR